MNIFSISAEKESYIPKKINPTVVSGGSSNPTGATAREIATGILGRKLFAAIPAEMFTGLSDAQHSGDTTTVARIWDSMTNLIGSTLLKLQYEAEEGSLMLKLINERLDEFVKEFGNPIPNYTPFIPHTSTLGTAIPTMVTEYTAVSRETEKNVRGNDISADFSEAKSNFLKLLFSEYFYQVLFAKVDASRQLTEPANNDIINDLVDKFFKELAAEIELPELVAEVHLIKDAIQKHNYNLYTHIPLLSEAETAELHASVNS